MAEEKIVIINEDVIPVDFSKTPSGEGVNYELDPKAFKKIGATFKLKTTDKETLVGAINENSAENSDFKIIIRNVTNKIIGIFDKVTEALVRQDRNVENTTTLENNLSEKDMLTQIIKRNQKQDTNDRWVNTLNKRIEELKTQIKRVRLFDSEHPVLTAEDIEHLRNSVKINVVITREVDEGDFTAEYEFTYSGYFIDNQTKGTYFMVCYEPENVTCFELKIRERPIVNYIDVYYMDL